MTRGSDERRSGAAAAGRDAALPAPTRRAARGERTPRIALTLERRRGREPRTLALEGRRARIAIVAIATLLASAIAMVASWGPVARRAATAEFLALENDSLRAKQARIDALAARVATMEVLQRNIQTLFGVSESRDSILWQLATRGGAPPATAADPEAVGSAPTAWPLSVRGHVTQMEGIEGDHPGIDVAVPTGSYVRAAGSGEVVAAANDPVYGLFVLIDHGGGVRTRYGHASVLVAEPGQQVQQGEVIALSGTTGRSTAPHLHFEVTVWGRQVDPLTLVAPP